MVHVYERRAIEGYTDDAYAGGVHLDKEPLHGILCRRRQQQIVTRHDDIAKLLTTRLRGLPGVTAVQESPAPVAGLAGARGGLEGGGEGAQASGSLTSRSSVVLQSRRWSGRSRTSSTQEWRRRLARRSSATRCCTRGY